jgi:hypothetical protein
LAEYADLELGLHRRDAGSYAIDFRFSPPGSDADIRLGPGNSAIAQFDFDLLRAHSLDAREYGQLLTQSLFADPALKSAFDQALTSAQSLDAALRVRLLIGPTAPELHSLRWETLRDRLAGPDDAPLFTGENIAFSRYLSSLDWRPVRLRPKSDLSALAVVSNPDDLSKYGLAPVDVQEEFNRAQAGLGVIPVASLPGERVTLNNLVAHLRDGYDIFYLVCHGALIKGEPWLWLEDDAGSTARTSGNEFAIRLRELSQRPRLIVLGSCQSAGSGAGDALAALGPQLAEAGIPAVLAMQGNISVNTMQKLMPVFFEQLQKDGQIDRALAVARGAVRDRPDYWMPALFMRLKSGRIWYVPGFDEDRKAFEKWPALVRSIKRGQCTPILGLGLTESLLGSSHVIAQLWAETYHYPMAPHEREDLPQVAQYLAINQDKAFPRDELIEFGRQQINAHYANDLPAELRNGKTPLDQLIEAVWTKRSERQPTEPHKVLAQLPVPIYVTTNMDHLLARALTEAGKEPQVVICPWNEYVEQLGSIYDHEPDYSPTPQRPLVYHLFGCLSEPDSMVLTEDDYFDYLIGVTGNKDLIPTDVRRALADTALLFLGFQMDDWNFRVLFRSIVAQQGGGRRDRYAHIAAQIDPEEGRILEPERARRYLENYFAKGADISIYWGSADDFLKELHSRLNSSAY